MIMFKEKSEIRYEKENISYKCRLGTHLKELRKLNYFSQDLLASKMQLEGCDITRSAISKLERGTRKMCADEVKVIARVFNITCDELIDI